MIGTLLAELRGEEKVRGTLFDTKLRKGAYIFNAVKQFKLVFPSQILTHYVYTYVLIFKVGNRKLSFIYR